MRFAPSRASPMAMALPIPLLAPVTRTTLSRNFIDALSHLLKHSGCPTAIDGECRARDERCLIARKVEGRIGDLLGCPHASDCLTRAHLVVCLLRIWIFVDARHHEIGGDSARTQAIDPHTRFREVKCSAASEADHSMLTGTVGEPINYAAKAGGRGHIDNRAST